MRKYEAQSDARDRCRGEPRAQRLQRVAESVEHQQRIQPDEQPYAPHGRPRPAPKDVGAGQDQHRPRVDNAEHDERVAHAAIQVLRKPALQVQDLPLIANSLADGKRFERLGEPPSPTRLHLELRALRLALRFELRLELCLALRDEPPPVLSSHRPGHRPSPPPDLPRRPTSATMGNSCCDHTIRVDVNRPLSHGRGIFLYRRGERDAYPERSRPARSVEPDTAPPLAARAGWVQSSTP